MNQIYTIMPYKPHGASPGGWVFDDERVDLYHEPFVAGADLVIDRMVANIKNADQGFIMRFSHDPFPGMQHVFQLEYEEYGGNWYRALTMENARGWLCPALFRYFKEAPQRLYVQVIDIS